VAPERAAAESSAPCPGGGKLLEIKTTSIKIHVAYGNLFLPIKSKVSQDQFYLNLNLNLSLDFSVFENTFVLKNEIGTTFISVLGNVHLKKHFQE